MSIITQAPTSQDVAAVEQLRAAYQSLRTEVGKVIIGQDDVVEQVLLAIFCRGHAVLVGVPGLAKTLLVSTLSQVLDLQFKRIQFTPDLMPSDITGTEVIQDDQTTRQRFFKFLPGPIFTNLVLADEINRTPPKTQAALLEAMQERKVSIGGHEHLLPNPFFVLATQNPIEQEGTYPLPEAQLDRFLFMIQVGYPTADEEDKIMRQGTAEKSPQVSKVLTSEEILTLQSLVRRVPVADQVFQYAKKLVRMTRPNTPEANEYTNKWLLWGAGPRASMNLILAAKARAILKGQFHVTPDDVAAMAVPILRHRLVPTFAAQSENITTDVIVKKLIESVPKL